MGFEPCPKWRCHPTSRGALDKVDIPNLNNRSKPSIGIVSNMSLRKYAIAILAIIGGFIVLHFATTKYPTHSDVFWYGVIVGFLATLLLICLGLIAFLAYRLVKKKE